MKKSMGKYNLNYNFPLFINMFKTIFFSSLKTRGSETAGLLYAVAPRDILGFTGYKDRKDEFVKIYK